MSDKKILQTALGGAKQMIELVSKYTSPTRTNYVLKVDEQEVDVSFVYNPVFEGGTLVIPTWLEQRRVEIKEFLKAR